LSLFGGVAKDPGTVKDKRYLQRMFAMFIERRGDLVVRALDFGSSGPGSIPRPGCHVVSLGKTLLSQCLVFSDKDVKPEAPSAFTLCYKVDVKEPLRT